MRAVWELLAGLVIGPAARVKVYEGQPFQVVFQGRQPLLRERREGSKDLSVGMPDNTNASMYTERERLRRHASYLSRKGARKGRKKNV